MSLKEKTINSMAVVYFYKFLWMGINFARSVIVARLLFPSDFGIISLALTFVYFVEQLFTFGFSKIIIQKKDITEKELNTAFSLNIFQNVIFFCIIYFGAPYVALYYRKPVLELVVQFLGFEILTQCIGFIPRVILQKKMQFKTVESINFTANILSASITITLAFIGFSFWSIVVASIVSNLLKACLFLHLSHMKAKICFDLGVIKSYLKTGSIIYASAILTYLYTTLDAMIIGKLSGIVVLGYYTVAKQWARYFHDMLFTNLNSVLFPSYSMIQDDRARLRSAVCNVFRHIIPIMLPCYVGLLMIAPEFVSIVLGERWTSVVLPLRVMLFAMCFESIGWIFGPIGDAIGKFDIRLKIISTSVMTISVFYLAAGTLGGLIWYSIALCVCTIIAFYLSYSLTCIHELRLSWIDLWRLLKKPCMSTAIMCVSVYIIRLITNNLPGVIILITMVSLGGLVYFSCILLFDREIIMDYLNNMRKIRILKK